MLMWNILKPILSNEGAKNVGPNSCLLSQKKSFYHVINSEYNQIANTWLYDNII